MTPGQIAYNEDLRRCPNYHDGDARPGWDALPDYAKATWEKNPKPRFMSKKENHDADHL